MNRFQSFQDFFAGQNVQTSIVEFGLNLLISALLAFVLGFLYERYGVSMSNRRMFAKNFVILTMTTMFIITVVKSSLALSLGLVGALSIVRFRAAIKEPEELSFLFICIAIGLGLGAEQRLITIIAFVLLAGIIIFRSRSHRYEDAHNLQLIVTTDKPRTVSVERVTEVLRGHSRELTMKRLDTTQDTMEALYIIDFASTDDFMAAQTALRALDEAMRITFLDNKTIL